MNTTTSLFTAGILLLAMNHAFAVKVLVEMTPEGVQSEESGFSVKTESDDGKVVFVVERVLSQARSFPKESELAIGRSASLAIYDEAGFVARCNVAGERKKDVMTYRFTLSEAAAGRSHFRISEIDEYKDKRQPQLLGGGTFYEFELAKFVSGAVTLQRP